MQRAGLAKFSALALASAIACWSCAPLSAQVNHPVRLVGTQWKLVDLEGKRISEDADLYLALKPVEHFSGGSTGQVVSPSTDGCNNLTAYYEAEDRYLHIHFLTSTLMACPVATPPAGQRSGAPATSSISEPGLFIKVLRQTGSFKIRGSTLELLNPDGEIIARLTAAQN